MNTNLESEINTLIEELDRVHSCTHQRNDEENFPDFVTTSSGLGRYFLQNSRVALRNISQIIYSNRSPILPKIEIDEYVRIVRQVIADMHASYEFSGFRASDQKNQNDLIGKLKTLIEDRLAGNIKAYTHYFPASDVVSKEGTPFQIGPVTIINRLDWIESVDFPEAGKENYRKQREANFCWKKILREALDTPNVARPLEGLADCVYSAIYDCQSLIKVTVSNYERKFSCKLAKIISKTALDAISLGLGDPRFFLQQTLHEERLPPVMTSGLMESEGYLWLPGFSLGKRRHFMSDELLKERLIGLAEIKPAFEAILEGLLNPSKHKHPKLANRWATALDWFGEASRDENDAIALTKFGTCLDVLSCGGKHKGIVKMLVNLTDANEKTEVVGGSLPRTLSQLVEDIYNSGRSKILHGTSYDRLESHNIVRDRAACLARLALIETAARLQSYNGQDTDNAFRTIGPNSLKNST